MGAPGKTDTVHVLPVRARHPSGCGWRHKVPAMQSVVLMERVPAMAEVKNHMPMQETQVQSLGREDPLEKEIATHFSVLAWEVP